MAQYNGPLAISPEFPNSDVRKRQRRIATREDGPNKHPVHRKKACQTCRIRKVKCDAARPICSLCKCTGASCEYLDAEDDKRNSLTLDTVAESLYKRLDAIQSLLESHIAKGHSTEAREELLPTENEAVLGSSKGFLQIPSQRTAADAILTWPVFEGRYASDSLVSVMFHPEQDEDPKETAPTTSNANTASHEDAVYLVDRFLQNVHTKNPIIDVELLLEHARHISMNGFCNDARSCLVMLACALGSIAEPFNAAADARDGELEAPEKMAQMRKRLARGESYFVLACQRLGCLTSTIAGIQCHFFAGVYLMYTLRPLRSWHYFINASTLYTLYDKLNHGPAGRQSELPDDTTMEHISTSDCHSRIEQSLYWSCFKSECEFRIELPLPLTEIGSIDHPKMFPTPPSLQSNDQLTQDTPAEAELPPDPLCSSLATRDSVSFRAHVKALCKEEESWYYYLTEIALRRVGNRIVNAFFCKQPVQWMNVQPLLGIALEFDSQVSSWSARLPPAMQHWESTYTIRAPNQRLRENSTECHVSRELSWATENRLLEIRSWLYQPFLFYLIHHTHDTRLCELCRSQAAGVAAVQYAGSAAAISPLAASAAAISPLAPSDRTENHVRDDLSALQHLIASGIECNLTTIENRSLKHRHHGLWFDLRSLMSASLILLAIVRTGHENFIPGGVETLWGPSSSQQSVDAPIGGKIGRVLAQFMFWKEESPDMERHFETLESITRYVRSLARA